MPHIFKLPAGDLSKETMLKIVKQAINIMMAQDIFALDGSYVPYDKSRDSLIAFAHKHTSITTPHLSYRIVPSEGIIYLPVGIPLSSFANNFATAYNWLEDSGMIKNPFRESGGLQEYRAIEASGHTVSYVQTAIRGCGVDTATGKFAVHMITDRKQPGGPRTLQNALPAVFRWHVKSIASYEQPVCTSEMSHKAITQIIATLIVDTTLIDLPHGAIKPDFSLNDFIGLKTSEIVKIDPIMITTLSATSGAGEMLYPQLTGREVGTAHEAPTAQFNSWKYDAAKVKDVVINGMMRSIQHCTQCKCMMYGRCYANYDAASQMMILYCRMCAHAVVATSSPINKDSFITMLPMTFAQMIANSTDERKKYWHLFKKPVAHQITGIDGAIIYYWALGEFEGRQHYAFRSVNDFTFIASSMPDFQNCRVLPVKVVEDL